MSFDKLRMRRKSGGRALAAALVTMASFSSTSDEVMAQVAWKKQVTHAKKLFETTTQAPSPSKDYVHILVTERGVIHRRFPITLRGVSQGAIPTPTEKIMTLEDFVIDADFQNEIGRTFGKETLDQVNTTILPLFSQYHYYFGFCR